MIAHEPVPALGPTACAAPTLSIGGHKRRKLAVLIGAYIDAGADDPSIRMLGDGSSTTGSSPSSAAKVNATDIGCSGVPGECQRLLDP